jgi:hypothetical protein
MGAIQSPTMMLGLMVVVYFPPIFEPSDEDRVTPERWLTIF